MPGIMVIRRAARPDDGADERCTGAAGGFAPAAPVQRSKDRQTKACGITLVIIAIMTICVLGTQLDGCNH